MNGSIVPYGERYKEPFPKCSVVVTHGPTVTTSLGQLALHVLNRANGRMLLFDDEGDYAAFKRVFAQACDRVSMRLLAYCVMPNHWHLVLWPRGERELSRFMGWLTLTHTQRWHAFHENVGTGHLYQGRFKSFVVQADDHLLTVCRYVERNALRANLVDRAEQWRWGSLWQRESGELTGRRLLSDWPVERPQDWVQWVNQPESATELKREKGTVWPQGPSATPVSWSIQEAGSCTWNGIDE